MWRVAIIQTVLTIRDVVEVFSEKVGEFARWVEQTVCDHRWDHGVRCKLCGKCFKTEWYDDET